MKKGFNRIKFLNTHVDNLNFKEAIDSTVNLIESLGKSYIVTPNVDHIVKISEDEEFTNIYKNADLILTDGMPLIWVSKLKGAPIKEKISGSDFFPKLCEVAAQKKYSIFLFGAAEGVGEIAAINLKKKYNGINIVGTYSPPYGFENSEDEIKKSIETINKVKPHILAVGLGAPKQEKFIYRNIDKLDIKLALAIGATIDFEAKKLKRAPVWMQNSGFEWLYRVLKEPRRLFKRYFIDSFKVLKIIFEN
ncbi:WecB/TagA/CpsF family glycosyltransferase [uncultured Ilyobacter sp.]|uniref:WecB/TagA/CpsF family glycosyltransferase n=1 Tax=uncultured Ilyobacter sp. TaxID=544433 RepID=UPI0029F57CC7|nr:WecB/TagA/CpsF family glycosyltransferase [uncultured Ilyobacter sp.]